MLRRSEGTTVAQSAAATGRNGNTVRGFLAGLNKGHTISMLERVCQVGPKKTGAKRSFTIDRITP